MLQSNGNQENNVPASQNQIFSALFFFLGGRQQIFISDLEAIFFLQKNFAPSHKPAPVRELMLNFRQ